jgi:hypothetical protein
LGLVGDNINESMLRESSPDSDSAFNSSDDEPHATLAYQPGW